MVLRSATSSVRSRGQFFRAGAQFGHHRAEQHRGAQRLQRVFRPHQQRRRRAPSGALQGRQHFDDLGAARIERAANLLLAAVERTQPRFGFADPGLDAAHLGCDVDQLLVELAAVLADRGDIGLQFLLQFGCVLLLRAGGLEFLLALLDGVGRRRAPPLAAPGLITCATAGESDAAARQADSSDRQRMRRVAADGVGVRSNGPALAASDSGRSLVRHARSGAVIRVAGQNGRGPVNLFQKHDSDHLMRPGRRAERNA